MKKVLFLLSFLLVSSTVIKATNSITSCPVRSHSGWSCGKGHWIYAVLSTENPNYGTGSKLASESDWVHAQVNSFKCVFNKQRPYHKQMNAFCLHAPERVKCLSDEIPIKINYYKWAYSDSPGVNWSNKIKNSKTFCVKRSGLKKVSGGYKLPKPLSRGTRPGRSSIRNFGF
jgi:hypothetical protein